jgi:hypothetical protein
MVQLDNKRWVFSWCNNLSVQARAAALVFVSTFLTFMAIGGFPAFVEDVKV